MKLKNTLFLLLGFGIIGSGCTIDEQPEAPIETPVATPTEEYVRIKMSSELTRSVWTDEQGDGDLIFEWEKTSADSEEARNMSIVISDGNMPLSSWESPETVSNTTGWYHSWLGVYPFENERNHADFISTRYFSQADLKNARSCFAVAGNTELTEDRDEGMHIFQMSMPTTFIQEKNQDPSFLREYMYMCAGSEYNQNGSTSLKFEHIPATFRFIITNTGSAATSLQEISLYVSDSSTAEGKEIASANSEVAFNWTTGEYRISYSEDFCESITTIIEGEDNTLEAGEKYTAYSMVLPLSSNDALKDKLVNIKIKRDDSEYLAYQINPEKLAKANGNDIYNWVGGKSYTISIRLEDDTAVRGYITNDNDIAILSSIPGTYTLRYEDEEGKPLSDFIDICTLNVNDYDFTNFPDFISSNTAPHDAEAIGIYDAEDYRVGAIDISTFKHSEGEPLYSVGLLSDIHCEFNSNKEPTTDFKKALLFFKNKGASLICTCGDITQNGTEKELSLYQELVTTYSPSIPVYTTSGNHDCCDTGDPIDEEMWTKYTGQPLVYEVTVPLQSGRNDHFIFLGMSRWHFTAAYQESHLTWLEEKLEEYSGERCFIFTHLFFPDRAGNFKEIYPSYNWLRAAQLTRLQSMCDNYTNSFWFSGHSHWKWRLQKHEDKANVYRCYDQNGRATSGWCVHVPSCAHPTDSDGVSSRVGMPLESEGAIMHVYEDHVDIQGIDLKNTNYLPIASYSLSSEL